MTFGNDTPNWKSKWARSPRQDRRVIEEGKFVELGKVQLPDLTQEKDCDNIALEVVNDGTGSSEGIQGSADGATRSEPATDRVAQETEAGSGPICPTTGPLSSSVGLDAGPKQSEGLVNEPIESSTSTSPNVRLDGPVESIGERDGAAEQANSASGQGETGVVQFVPEPSVPSTEEPLIDAVVEHIKGSQTIQEIAELACLPEPPLIAPFDIVDEANGIERKD